MSFPLVIPVIGVDLSLSNLGIAFGEITSNGALISVNDLRLVQTQKSKVKTLRRSADDYDRATQLKNALHDACLGRKLAMVEMPIGSQSARAMMSYGLCIALIASLPIPVIQVTPREVKEMSFGDKDAAKEDMINWATEQHDEAPWLRNSQGGLLGKNEHLADAVACLYAGSQSQDFKRAVSMMKSIAA